MIRLRDTKHSHTGSFLTDAIKTAEYYGFSPFEEALKAHKAQTKSLVPVKSENEIAFARREERALAQVAKRAAPLARLMRRPDATEYAPEARFVWRTVQNTGPIPSISLELHVLGTSSAIAEALLLVVAHAIADEAGLPQRSLLINNIGSIESSNRYVRDIGNYLRKHIDTISPNLRPRVAQDPLGALVQLIERRHPSIARAPQAMEYLIEEERRRFWELLEYLEICGVPYELSPHILGSRDCWAHSLYEISSRDEETGARVPLAFGGRYDPLTTRYNGHFTPAATISITCEVRGKNSFKREVPGMPSLFLAHLGIEARRKSLSLLETLRRASIPVYHSLASDHIGEQMTRAKELAMPYLIIMGYKEAMEDTVMVREVATNAQETVPAQELSAFLKRRRIGSSRNTVAA